MYFKEEDKIFKQEKEKEKNGKKSGKWCGNIQGTAQGLLLKKGALQAIIPVSYTHLTLPTKA